MTKLSAKVLTLVLFITAFLSVSLSAFAEDEIRDFSLNLREKSMNQSGWSDNLDSSRIIFAPGNQILLEVVLQNHGNRNQTNVVVSGTLPETVSVASADNVTVNGSQVAFTIPQIAAGQDYSKNILLSVKDKSQINKDLTKNTVVFSTRTEGNLRGYDTAYFYTGNGIKNISAQQSSKSGVILPDTGSNIILISTLISLSGAALALGLRRLARGY
ncbi:MAG TPA: hypothetical protein VF828_03665 [Patescibacteria group bacterium]